ncbi:DddA-like double-stranded DNA deaminase toxin [Kribbella sp. CA-294648]|uniref:DddA-like double-stranded DNA deaminase toxin n=1 Tax=Kribbella sp. CA-294648 TaxID=3239948 RepID=UPI003D913F91
MPSELQRVAQELLDTLNQIERIVPYMHDRARKYREAAGWVGSTSNNPSARMAAMQLDEAARRCEEAAHFLTQARDPGIKWVQQMVSGIRTTEPTGRPTAERLQGPGGSTPPAERRRNDNKAEREADKPREDRAAGDGTSPEDERPPRQGGRSGREVVDRLPKRVVVQGQRVKTRGKWIDDNGGEHDLVSGQHEEEYEVAQRHAERLGRVRRGAKLSTAADVELKFAMRMRRDGITRATIYLNNRPCVKDMSCTTLLPEFLPPGSELTIYGPGDYEKTFRGVPETP